MKKHLVLALAALALVACGNTTTTAPTATSTTAAPTAQTITIDKDDQTELKAAIEAGTSSTYHSEPCKFESSPENAMKYISYSGWFFA